MDSPKYSVSATRFTVLLGGTLCHFNQEDALDCHLASSNWSSQ